MIEIVVLAGTYGQARSWANKKGYHPSVVRIVRGPDSYYGLFQVPFVKVGEWWKNRDLAEFERYAESHEIVELETE